MHYSISTTKVNIYSSSCSSSSSSAPASKVSSGTLYNLTKGCSTIQSAPGIIQRGNQKKTYVIGILDKDKLAFRLLEHKVSNSSHDTPTVGKGDVHLSSKVKRLK